MGEWLVRGFEDLSCELVGYLGSKEAKLNQNQSPLGHDRKPELDIGDSKFTRRYLFNNARSPSGSSKDKDKTFRSCGDRHLYQGVRFCRSCNAVSGAVEGCIHKG